MTATARADYRAQAAIIKALAHPTRLFIVNELSRSERCVNDLTAMIGVEMPTVSRHLSQLKNVGILLDEKRGSHVFYRLRFRACSTFSSAFRPCSRTARVDAPLFARALSALAKGGHPGQMERTGRDTGWVTRLP